MGVSPITVLPAEEKPGFVQKAALWLFRAAALLAGMAMFFPPANPGRISEKINEASLREYVVRKEYGDVLLDASKALEDNGIGLAECGNQEIELLIGLC